MNDLPSQLVARQLARLIREGYELNIDGLQETASILQAVGSGRLVDRDTIDYDRMRDYADDLGHPMTKGFIRDLVALGIGGSDEK